MGCCFVLDSMPYKGNYLFLINQSHSLGLSLIQSHSLYSFLIGQCRALLSVLLSTQLGAVVSKRFWFFESVCQDTSLAVIDIYLNELRDFLANVSSFAACVALPFLWPPMQNGKKEIDNMTRKLIRNINWMLKWTVTFDGSNSDLIRPMTNGKWTESPRQINFNATSFFVCVSNGISSIMMGMIIKELTKPIVSTVFSPSSFYVFENKNVKTCMSRFSECKRRQWIHSIGTKHRFYSNVTKHEKRMDQTTFIYHING